MKNEVKADIPKEEHQTPVRNSKPKSRIRFSTLETQGDIQLEFSQSLTPAQRLDLMYELNMMVFKVPAIPRSLKKTRIIFTRYEYLAE